MMNAELPEKREYELSERYNRGERQGANEEERTLFAAYDRLREGLRTLPAPEVDRHRLAEAMKREMRAPSGSSWLDDLLAMAPRSRAAAAVVLIGCALCLAFLLGPRPSAMEVRFEDANGSVQAPPWWWRLQAGFGLPVRAPGDQTATITLKDGSVVICQPGTVAAFTPGNQRSLFLSSGEITVHAEHDPDAPFTVSTPLGDARVAGTVFHVRILFGDR